MIVPLSRGREKRPESTVETFTTGGCRMGAGSTHTTHLNLGKAVAACCFGSIFSACFMKNEEKYGGACDGMGKNRRGRAGSLSSKRDDDGARGRARHDSIDLRSHSGEFGPSGRLRRNPITACIPCIQAHSSGKSAMPHSSLPPLQTISVGPSRTVYTLPSG